MGPRCCVAAPEVGSWGQGGQARTPNPREIFSEERQLGTWPANTSKVENVGTTDLPCIGNLVREEHKEK